MIRKEYIVYLLVFFILGMFYPGYWSAAIGFTPSMILYVIFLFCWAVLLSLFNYKFHKLSKTYNQLYILFILYFSVRLLFSWSEDYIIRLIQLVVFYVTTFLVYNSFYIKKNFMRYFIKWNIIMLFLTILGLLLFYLWTLPPIGDISIGGGSDTKRLVNYGFFFVKVNTDFVHAADLINFLRPAGYYDEPGSFAYVITLLLLYNKLHLNNKKIEFILLYGGLILMSMAYYAVFCCYILLFYFNKKTFCITLIITVFLLFLLNKYEPENGTFYYYFYDKVIERFFNIVEGTDSSRNYDDAFQAFKKYIILGATNDTLSKEFPTATHETIWYFFAQNGLLGGMFLLLIPFALVSPYQNQKENRIKYIKTMLIILLLCCQRPDYINPLYLTLLYFLYYSKTENIKLQSNTILITR